MRAVIGSKGKVGSTLLRSQDRGFDKGDAIDLNGVTEVVHAAIDWSDRGRGHVEQLLDVLEKCGSVQRVIYFSSVWADPQAYGLLDERPHDYTAAKLSCEAFLRSWQGSADGRDAVALRIGAFHPENPTVDAAWRLSQGGLLWHFRRAQLVKGFHIWAAWGDGDRDNPNARLPEEWRAPSKEAERG